MPKNAAEPTPDPTPDGPPEPEQPEELDETVDEAVVVEIDGHEYTIDADTHDDFELLDDLNEMSRTGDSQIAAAVMRRLIGPTQTRLALNRLRDDETGRVSVEVGTEFVLKLLDGLNPN